LICYNPEIAGLIDITNHFNSVFKIKILSVTEKNNIPIALFAYARPDHLARTLEGLRKSNVPLIYAFCDGARDDSVVAQVKKVREILHTVDWARIFITERESNLGLGTSVRAGVTEVLELHDKVIVIEDDIVMRPGAYDYACSALNHYENDNRVMSVTMWNHPIMVPGGSEYGFFSERFMCWGWGTYRKYWQLYSGSIREIYYSLEPDVKDRVNKYGRDLFRQVDYSQIANIWYAGYAFLHFKLGKLSYFPPEPLVVNIGKDHTAEHDGPGHTSYLENEDLISVPVSMPVENDFPEPLLLKRTARLFNRYFYLKHPFRVRVWRFLKKKMYFAYRPFKKYLG